MKNLPLNEEIVSAIFIEKGAPQIFKTNAIIIASLAEMPNAGNFTEMTDRVVVMQKVKKAISENQDGVLLESTDHSQLVKALKERKYEIVDTAIYDYIQRIADLPDAQVKLETVNKKKSA